MAVWYDPIYVYDKTPVWSSYFLGKDHDAKQNISEKKIVLLLGIFFATLTNSFLPEIPHGT